MLVQDHRTAVVMPMYILHDVECQGSGDILVIPLNTPWSMIEFNHF